MTYSVPLFIALNVNKENDPAGSMFDNEIDLEEIEMKEMHVLTNSNESQRVSSNIQNAYVENVNTFPEYTQQCRRIWFGYVGGLSWMWLAMIIMIFAAFNMYNYSEWLAITIFVIGGIIGCGFIVAYCTVCNKRLDEPDDSDE